MGGVLNTIKIAPPQLMSKGKDRLFVEVIFTVLVKQCLVPSIRESVLTTRYNVRTGGWGTYTVRIAPTQLVNTDKDRLLVEVIFNTHFLQIKK